MFGRRSRSGAVLSACPKCGRWLEPFAVEESGESLVYVCACGWSWKSLALDVAKEAELTAQQAKHAASRKSGWWSRPPAPDVEDDSQARRMIAVFILLSLAILFGLLIFGVFGPR